MTVWMKKRRRRVGLGVVAVIVVWFFWSGGPLGGSDHYFKVTLLNRAASTVALYQCTDTKCRDREPPELLKPGHRTWEWGSSTVDSQFVVATRPANGKTVCINLRFKRAPNQPVVFHASSGALVMSDAPSC